MMMNKVVFVTSEIRSDDLMTLTERREAARLEKAFMSVGQIERLFSL